MTPADGDNSRTYPDGKPLPEQPPWQRDFPTDVPEDDHVARREIGRASCRERVCNGV